MVFSLNLIIINNNPKLCCGVCFKGCSMHFYNNTCAESWQEGLALEHLNNLPSNRLEEVQRLIRQGNKMQEQAESLQAAELWVVLNQRKKTALKDIK